MMRNHIFFFKFLNFFFAGAAAHRERSHNFIILLSVIKEKKLMSIRRSSRLSSQGDENVSPKQVYRSSSPNKRGKLQRGVNNKEIIKKL